MNVYHNVHYYKSKMKIEFAWIVILAAPNNSNNCL